MSFSSRTMRDSDWGLLQNFNASEFRAPERMGFEFMLWLQQLRTLYGKPLRIISSWRSPDQNAAANGATRSTHMRTPCEAVDIVGLSSADRFQLTFLAFALGCRRFGIYENGSLHIDLDPDSPQNVIWVKVTS
jgi:uncharacterized protein YcbK (DUF882 family)